MIKTVEVPDMKYGDEVVVTVADELTITLEQAGIGYILVAKRKDGPVCFSKALPFEQLVV